MKGVMNRVILLRVVIMLDGLNRRVNGLNAMMKLYLL